MIVIVRGAYILLLSYNPCDVFTYYEVEQMHGLSLTECMAYNNTSDDAYIAGWSNFVPNETDKRFVFINLSRCGSDVETFGLIMHELMHQSFHMHIDEEEIITWAEEESYEVFKIIKQKL
jgi:hypothetical protein